MPKTYRTIQQWNHWLTSSLGKNLLQEEQSRLMILQREQFGKTTVLLGVPHQATLLATSISPCQFLLSPLHSQDKNTQTIEGNFYQLALQSGSVDQVIVPHTMEFLDNPHQLLLEACRIVKPEGRIYVLGFNKYSLWGLKKIFTHKKMMPWIGNFLPIRQIKKWLALADFELEQQEMLNFRPPFTNHELYQKFKFLEWVGNKIYKPFGGIYILQAKAKVVPLTPIRLHWTQRLPNLGMSVRTLPGSNIRNPL